MKILIVYIMTKGKDCQVIDLQTDINPKVGNFLFGAEKQFYKITYKKYIQNLITPVQMETLSKIEEKVTEIGLTNFPEKTRPHIKNTINLAKTYFMERNEENEEENLQLNTITLSQILNTFLQNLISFSILKKSPDQQQETPTTEIISTPTQEERKKRSATTKWMSMESTTGKTVNTVIQGNYMSQDLKECEDLLKDEDNNISNKNMKTDLKREEKNEIKEQLCNCRMHIINFQSYFTTKSTIGRIVGRGMGRKITKPKAITILDLYLRKKFGKLVMEKIGMLFVVCDDLLKGKPDIEENSLEDIDNEDSPTQDETEENHTQEMNKEVEVEVEHTTEINSIPKPDIGDELSNIIEDNNYTPYDPDTPYNQLTKTGHEIPHFYSIKNQFPSFYYSPGKQNKEGQIIGINQEILEEIYYEDTRLGNGCRQKYLTNFENSEDLQTEIQNTDMSQQFQFEVNYQEQYLSCLNKKPRTTRSPTTEGKIEVTTVPPINSQNAEIKMDALFTQSITQLNVKDQQMYKLLYIDGSNRIMESSYRLNHFILNQKLEVEIGQNTGIFSNLVEFSLASGINNLIQVISMENDTIGLIQPDQIYFKAQQTIFCRIDNCYKLLDIYVENLYILEIKNSYKFCAQLEKIKNMYICKRQDVLPQCSFGTFNDENCAFSRIPLIKEHFYENGATKVIISETTGDNIIIRNIGSTDYKEGNLELKPLMEVSGENVEKLLFHMSSEEIAAGTHLINIQTIHIFNLYHLEKGVGWILISIIFPTISTLLWFILLLKWIYSHIQIKIINKHKELQDRLIETRVRICRMEQQRAIN